MSKNFTVTFQYRASNVKAAAFTHFTLRHGALGPQLAASYRFYPLVLSISSNAAISAGSATFRVTSDGTPLGRGPIVVLNDAAQAASNMVNDQADSIAPEAEIGLRIETSADYAPDTADFDATLVGVVRQVSAANVYPKAAPRLVSGEVGTVDAYTVVIEFDVPVSAADFAAGVTINVGSNPAVIDSTALQTDDHFVYYVVHDAVVANQVITWGYDPDLGNIVSEAEGVELVDSLLTVTDNVAEVPPEFDSAEVGTVDATTVAVTFDSDVVATNYATGVTIKVNNVAQAISSATRQTDHSVVYYVIPAVISTDTVTWAYSATTGVIKAALDNSALATVAAQAVTNNVSAVTPHLLRAQIGEVDRTTLIAYFDVDVASADFTAGISISVNAAPVVISAGVRQTDHKVVYFTIPDVIYSDNVIFGYDDDTGSIASEIDGTPLAFIAPAPAINSVAAIVPEFSAAEVGTVDATTVAVTLTEDVTAAGSDYSTGATILVNAAPVLISAGVRQTNHAIIYYTVPACVSTDVITWSYSDTTGIILGEVDASPLADVTLEAVTNNVPP
jgi:hypothetical protein